MTTLSLWFKTTRANKNSKMYCDFKNETFVD